MTKRKPAAKGTYYRPSISRRPAAVSANEFRRFGSPRWIVRAPASPQEGPDVERPDCKRGVKCDFCGWCIFMAPVFGEHMPTRCPKCDGQMVDAGKWSLVDDQEDVYEPAPSPIAGRESRPRPSDDGEDTLQLGWIRDTWPFISMWHGPIDCSEGCTGMACLALVTLVAMVVAFCVGFLLGRWS